jgi:hypothetical protein
MTDMDMASTPVTTAQGAGLLWTKPDHWTEKPASAMRRGTLTVTDDQGQTAELAITAFPGDVGGNLANVNRWRGQLQLPPIGEAELGPALEHADYNGLHFDIVDIPGPPGPNQQRMLGAIVPYGQATWFFKFTGPDALVQRERETFRTFLTTVKAP